jgi:hypothetical protein
MSFERIAGIVTFVLVAGGVALGFAATGSPQRMRLVELDRRRVENLTSLADDLRDGYGARGAPRLPDRLSRTDDPDPRKRDPQTGKPYEYEREGAKRFRLCATFALASEPTTDTRDAWAHGAGRTCFRFDLSRGGPLSGPVSASKR